LSWISSEPGAWASLLGRKALLEWNGVEAVDTDDLYTYADWSPLLNAARRVLFFGVLAPLAMLGIWITRRRWRDLWLISALTAAYAVSVILFYVLARYRYPLAILLAPFAGAGIAGAWGWWRRASVWNRVGALSVTLASAVICNLPLLSVDGMRSGMHYNVGYTFQSSGRTQEAMDQYRQAIALRPDNIDAHNALGVVLASLGSHDEALAEYRAALQLDPLSVGALTNLGVELAQRGLPVEAVTTIERAIAIDPKNAEAHYDLGVALATTDQLDRAMQEFHAAIRLKPDYADAHNNLGGLLAMHGRFSEAIEQFRAALAARSDFPAAKANLDRALAEIKK
jgi:Flp pilus assembly protein TadD